MGDLSILPIYLFNQLLTSVCTQRSSRYATSKYATLLLIFWAKGTRERADEGRTPWRSPFYLKPSPKISHAKGVVLIPGQEDHSYHQRLEINSEMNLYKQTYQHDPYLPLVSLMYFPVAVWQFSAPVPFQIPVSCHIPTIYCSLFKNVYKHLGLAASLGFQFPSKDSCVHVK